MANGLLNRLADETAVTAAFDLEGTLTRAETWRGMRDYLETQGQGKRFRRFFLSRVPQLLLFRYGLLDKTRFKERWILGVLNLFNGVPRDEFDAMADWVVEELLWPERRQDVVAELHAHQSAGRRVIVVTGMFEPIVAAFLRRLGDVEGIGTPVVFENGRCTGKIQGEINVGPRKVAQLQPFARDGKIAYAYGDTGADVDMLAMSEHPVAVYPDAALRVVAEERGWRILEEENA